jgi:NDP-sugar pyrophosphorylase family protein
MAAPSSAKYPASNLSALVLTAGLGTRLAPLTSLVAKPAVPLAGRTLIEHVLEWLRTQQIVDVVLNLHHLPHTITGVIGDGAHLGMRVRYSWEPVVLGSAGGPRRALSLMHSDPFLIVNGDTLCEVDINSLRQAFDAYPTDVLMAVVPNPAPLHYNGIVLDDERRVTAFVPKGPKAAGSWHFTGVQIARASVFAGLRDGEPTETVAGIYRAMVAEAPGRVSGLPVQTRFLDVGTPADYLAAAVTLAGGDDRRLVDRDAAVDPRARLSRTIVWPQGRVDAGAQLRDCIVASGAVVGGDVIARKTLFMPGAITAIP